MVKWGLRTGDAQSLLASRLETNRAGDQALFSLFVAEWLTWPKTKPCMAIHPFLLLCGRSQGHGPVFWRHP